MTDFSLAEVDGNRMTPEALQTIIERTGKTRQRLRGHGFAQGNKIASELVVRRDEVTKDDIPIELRGGPTLRDDFSFTFRLPQTPASLQAVPQTIDQLLEVYADKMMGGNASNVLRNEVHLSQADLGPNEHHYFSPADKYLDAWIQEKTQHAPSRFNRHELTAIDPRYGLALPYEEGGKIQQFSFNKPQGSTIEPMRTHIETLRNLDHVVVSEGLGILLAQNNIRVAQIFNPTSALHTESALEMHRRMSDGENIWQDVTVVNDDEMEAWIKIMEERQLGIALKDITDAKFPMPFLKDNPERIDDNAVHILRRSHQRFINLGSAQETENTGIVMGVGCGPKGGQNQFQCKGRYYVAAASALDDDGAGRLIALCGTEQERGVQPGIRDVVGAGDAAFTATLMHRHYAPIEDIIEARHPNLSEERKRIAVMGFTTMLQRVFGELVYHSKVRDLSGVPPEAFPVIFDKVLDKAIAAAHEITMIDKVPSRVYRDEEWNMSFTTMEVERGQL
jgi:hypothetical protein